MKYISVFMMITPLFIVLFYLGGNVLPNVFDEMEMIDTRSFLYEEVGDHLKKYNAYLFGTPGIGYKTVLRFQSGLHADGTSFDWGDLWWHGRLTTETGILNLVLQGGLINVILMISIYMYAIICAINSSKNRYCLYVSMLLSFRLPFMFIDGLLTYYLQSIVLWMMFAICTKRNLLHKTENQVKKIYQIKLI